MPPLIVLGALTLADTICANSTRLNAVSRSAAESCSGGSDWGGQGQVWASAGKQEEMTQNYRQNSDRAQAKPPRAWIYFGFTFALWLCTFCLWRASRVDVWKVLGDLKPSRGSLYKKLSSSWSCSVHTRADVAIRVALPAPIEVRGRREGWSWWDLPYLFQGQRLCRTQSQSLISRPLKSFCPSCLFHAQPPGT